MNQRLAGSDGVWGLAMKRLGVALIVKVVLLAAMPLCAEVAQNTQPSPAVGERYGVVSELLKRSDLLTDVQFSVPVEVLKRFEYEKTTPLVPPSSPQAVIVEHGQYHLSLPAEGKPLLTAKVRVRVLSTDSTISLPVLSSSYVWNNVTVNGKSSSLAVVDGFYLFLPQSQGVYEISGETSLPAIKRYGTSLALATTPSVMTTVQVDSKHAWRVAIEGEPREVLGADSGTYGRFSLSPRNKLAVVVGPVPVQYERPARYNLNGDVVWNLDAGRQQVQAKLKVDILGGQTDRLAVTLPAGARRVSVAGPDVRETRLAGRRVNVYLKGKISGRTLLNVHFELPDGKNETSFSGVGLSDGKWQGGTLLVTNSAGTREVILTSSSGLKELAPADIPDSAAAIAVGDISLAFGIAGRRWDLNVEVLDLGEFALRETIADLAHYQIAFRPDGTMLCKARYEIRNRCQQFARVDLPAGARVLRARVNDEASSMTSVKGTEDAYLIPLVRSHVSVRGLVSFPMEVVFLWKGPSLSSRKIAEIPLLRLDMPIAYAWCEAYVPSGMDVKHWGGLFKPVEQYSSQTAVATMSYGQGQLAQRYREQDRVKPKDGRAPLVGKNGRDGRRPKGGMSSGTKYLLARNYFRSGRAYYEQNDYANARKSLEKVVENAPDSTEAAASRKLLSNIDLAQGKLDLKSKAERVAGTQIRREIAARNLELEARQNKMIEEGLEAARQGSLQEARVKLQTAEALSKQLLIQGAKKSKVSSSMRKARAQLKVLQDDEVRFDPTRKEAMWGMKSAAADTPVAPTLGIPAKPKEMEQSRPADMPRMKPPVSSADKVPSAPCVVPGSKSDLRVTEIPWSSEITYPRDWGELAKRRTVTKGMSVGSTMSAGKPEIRKYDIRDMKVVSETGKAGVQFKRSSEVVDRLSDAMGINLTGMESYEESGGILTLKLSPAQHEVVQRLFGVMREARGPQLQMGSTIVQQQAKRMEANKPLMGKGGSPSYSYIHSQPAKDDPQLRHFIDRNYYWQKPSREVVATSFGSSYVLEQRDYADDLVKRLNSNLGQKVVVSSIDINCSPAQAQALGISFHRTRRGLLQAVIDQAQLRTLMEAGLQGDLIAPLAQANRSVQETIVGTEALLSNGMKMYVAFAGDESNVLVVKGKSVNLHHEKYLLLANRGSLTAVRTGRMQHWTEKAAVVAFPHVVPEIEVPRTGRFHKFEKSLVKATDPLVLRAQYEWQGE